MGKKSMLQADNNYKYSFIKDYLTSLVMNRFDWTGLPDNLNNYYIEKCLTEKGYGAFFKDEKLGFLFLPVNKLGGVNLHGESIYLQANGVGYNKALTEKDCVVIYNNIMRKSSTDLISIYAEKLFKIDNCMNINITGQKTPYVILCDKNNILSMKQIFRDIQENEPVIYADSMLDVNNITTLQTTAPYVTDKLRTEKNNILNEFLTIIGINNANTEKRERLITDEVNANNEYIMYSVDCMLSQRKNACEKINKMFGLNIDVKLKDVETKNINIEEGEKDE